MRATPFLAILLLSGCAAPAALEPAAGAAAPDDLHVVAFRVEANETRIDQAGGFRPALCPLEACAAATPLGWTGWQPWRATLVDEGLFWRVNATFSWADGSGLPARMEAYRLHGKECSGNVTQGPCPQPKPFAVAQGVPPLRIAEELQEGWLEGIALHVVPESGAAPLVGSLDGRWTGAIQAFHRAPGAEDVRLSPA